MIKLFWNLKRELETFMFSKIYLVLRLYAPFQVKERFKVQTGKTGVPSFVKRKSVSYSIHTYSM